MKKFTTLVVMMLVSLSMNAQDASANEKMEAGAKKWAAEMSQVLALTEAEQKEIYDIDLNKRIKIDAVNKEASAAMRKVLGPDRMKIWSDYRKEQQVKK